MIDITSAEFGAGVLVGILMSLLGTLFIMAYDNAQKEIIDLGKRIKELESAVKKP